VHKRSGKFTDVAEIEALVAEHLGVRAVTPSRRRWLDELVRVLP
jgi:hypothetical protein